MATFIGRRISATGWKTGSERADAPLSRCVCTAGGKLGGVELWVTGVAAARRPAGGNDGDGHAAAACGAESRGIQRTIAAEALGGRFAAAGAVRGHGEGHWGKTDGRMAIVWTMTGLRWRR